MRLFPSGVPRPVCLIFALALAACQGEKPAETSTAQGEVLPGSISDAMLPLDTVRSQPPLAPQTEAAGKSARSAAKRGDEADDGTAASDGATDAAGADATPVASAPAAEKAE